MKLVIIQEGNANRHGVTIDVDKVRALTETFYSNGETWQTTIFMKGGVSFSVNMRMKEVLNRMNYRSSLFEKE